MQLVLSPLFANGLQRGLLIFVLFFPLVSIILQLLHIAYDVNASRIHVKVAFMVNKALALTSLTDRIILLCCSFQWSSLSVHMKESSPTHMFANSEQKHGVGTDDFFLICFHKLDRTRI